MSLENQDNNINNDFNVNKNDTEFFIKRNRYTFEKKNVNNFFTRKQQIAS